VDDRKVNDRTAEQRARIRRTVLILGLVALAIFAWTLINGIR
jgi:hypothetical protein